MKDYTSEFQRKIDEINDDSKKVLIINAGSMNHGKSSLFNSLLDKPVFAENDVRETLVSKDQPWIEDVYLIDTPGLNAEESDDIEAYNAYKRANMIVFVHTVKAGELKKNELDAINIIKSVLGEKYFFFPSFSFPTRAIRKAARKIKPCSSKKAVSFNCAHTSSINFRCGATKIASFVGNESNAQSRS